MPYEKEFSWVQTHKELVQYLKNMQQRQRDLIEILEKAGVDLRTGENRRGGIHRYGTQGIKVIRSKNGI